MSSLPSHTPLTMPALSPTMEEGVIATWNKAEGDEIKAGESVCEIETDKATVDFELPEDGYLAKILVQAGSGAVKIGTPIGVLVEDEADIAAFANVTVGDLGGEDLSAAPAAPEPAKASVNVADTKTTVTTAVTPPTPVSARVGDRVFASPLARKTAAESGVDLATIQGTGPNSRVVNADVLDFLHSAPVEAPAAAAGSSQAAVGNVTDRPVTVTEQDVANALYRRKQEVPHYYLNSEVDITALLKLREKLNADLPDDSKVSVNDFLIRASAIVMRRVPAVNAAWHETFIRKYNYCDINVALQTDAGVLLPVIRNVESKGLAAIAQETHSLQAEVNNGESEAFGHGTFTITNLGMFGVKSFLPIVSDYQSASLGVGTISQTVVPNKDPDSKSKFQVKHVVTVSLSCDHRVVDGAVSAQWLQEFKTILEDPVKMLL